jgi:hypothetical protein
MNRPALNLSINEFPIAYTIGTDFKPAARRPVTDVIRWNGW